MAQEGIMALPMGAGMQEKKGRETPSVTSADSYDAATTAQGMVDPQSLAVIRETLRQNLADLEMTAGQLDMLIQMFEYMSQRPDQYQELVKYLVEQDIFDPGEMPEDYDPAFIGAILAALNELKLMRGENAMAPMMEGPGAEAQGPMPMAKGGLADAAQYLASQGRNGDTMLAHIRPEEAELLKSMGGSGTINPQTGLPEYGWLSKIWSGVKSVVSSVVSVVKKALQSPVGKILGTIALATVLGPTAIGMTLGSAGTAALASGAVTLASGGNLKEALVAGAMGYIGGGGTFGGVSPLKAVGEFLPGAAGSALNTGLTTGALGTGAGLLMGMKPVDALKMGAVSGLSAAAIQGLQQSGVGRTDQMLKDAQFRTEMGNPQPGDAELIAKYGARAGTGTAADQAGAPARAVGDIGATGTTGTARDLLNQQGPLQLPPGAAPEPGYTVAKAPSTGVEAPNINAPLQLPPGAAPEPGYTVAGSQPGFIDRMVSGAKDIYNEYLSPSRAGLPADAGILQKYGPLAAAGTAVVAAAGGMKGEPANQNPLYDRRYTSDDYMRDNPDKFRGGLDKPVVPTPSGLIPTPSYATREITNIPISLPGGITQSPAGVAQPYNVAGLYGVPLLYGPPPGRAKGGEMSMEDFPRKTGPINGPGTGTSDSIPAMLSDGEFVFTAKAVRSAGNGSRRKGAARMYKLMKMLEGGAVKGK